MNVSRHSDIIKNTDLETINIIVGCGSLGTAIATKLARLGFKNYVLFDNDQVETHNIANQYFEEEDLGKNKVDALKEKILKINKNVEIDAIKKELRGEELRTFLVNYEINVLVCVDNMKTRIDIWEEINKQTTLFKLIDMRMNLEEGQIHSINCYCSEKAKENYSKTLYDDEKAANEPCTAKTVIYTVDFITAIAAKEIINISTPSNITINGNYNSYIISTKDFTVMKITTK